jgi:dihydrolipoamide dehydrogenase
MSTENRSRVDVVVIGAGPGGYHAAIRAAQLGKSVVCVDRGAVGGVCLNTGCIPTKALLHVGEVAHLARHAGALGLDLGTVKIDLERVRAFRDVAVRANVRGVETLFRTNGVSFVRGSARLLSRRAVHVSAQDGTTWTFETNDIVLATGSEPADARPFTRDGVTTIDSDDAVRLDSIPDHLLVVGGGVIGLEIATAYRRLGAAVTIVERMPELLPDLDRDVARFVERNVIAEGIELRLRTTVKDLSGHQRVKVLLEDDARNVTTIVVDRILVAIGRRPVTRGLDLAAVGLTTTTAGFLEVDVRRQTRVPGIWAIGDVAGGPLLAHKAMHEGTVVAEAIAGQRGAAYDPIAVPSCIYTDPQIATAGLSEGQARALGRRVRTGKFPLSASGRARTMGGVDGVIKIVGDADDDLLLGVQIVAPQAESLIGEAVIALEMGARVEDIALSVHPHPTFAEALHDAACVLHGRAIHVGNPGHRSPGVASSMEVSPRTRTRVGFGL